MHKYCPNCGTVNQPTTRVKGSLFIELILWLCFFVPGIIYSIWRLTTKEAVCPACCAPNMIPVDSPKARAALREAAPTQPMTDLADLAARPKPSRLTQILMTIVVALFGLLVIIAVSSRPAAHESQVEAQRSVAAIVPADIPKSLAIAVDRYGPPDEDYSSENEAPRPPMVTRLLSYHAEHVRLIYVPANYKFNMPPPYTNGWILVGVLDPVMAKAISSQEAARRLAGRAR